jgi:glycosyltransferase involved in cell wall biosynthesis
VFARIGAGDRPFVFAVGNRTPQKNIQVVHEALALLGDAEFDVVHAGEANARVFGDGGTGAGTRPPGRGARLVSAGFVSDGELRALYERAACFVFPSVYEGFGLPPLEAMTCGCPVVAARAASIPEVCGDAAVYFDPHDPRDLAAALTRVMADPALRARLARDGRERAKRFSWRASAERVYDVLDEVLGERTPPATDAAAS